MCDAQEFVGQAIADKYVVDRVIGEGGMGTVLRAHHEELRTLVAIKVLKTGVKDNPEAVRRFLREARAAARLRSDHAVHVYDVGKLTSGEPYIVMEYLEGHDLAQELKLRSELPVAEATDILLQAMEAIAQAHAVGIVHRDLKPANLFLAAQSDGTRLVKVLDFGISKILADVDPSITESATVLGSPLYMAPEQIRNASTVGETADIWSLGVILYECLAGEPPYSGVTSSGVLATIVADAHLPLVERCERLPEALCQVVEDCLVKNPQERIASTAELAERLAVFATVEGRRLPPKIASILGVTPDHWSPYGRGKAWRMDEAHSVRDVHAPRTPHSTRPGGWQEDWDYPVASLGSLPPSTSPATSRQSAPRSEWLPRSSHSEQTTLSSALDDTAMAPSHPGGTTLASASSSPRLPTRKWSPAMPLIAAALAILAVVLMRSAKDAPPPPVRSPTVLQSSSIDRPVSTPEHPQHAAPVAPLPSANSAPATVPDAHLDEPPDHFKPIPSGVRHPNPQPKEDAPQPAPRPPLGPRITPAEAAANPTAASGATTGATPAPAAAASPALNLPPDEPPKTGETPWALDPLDGRH